MDIPDWLDKILSEPVAIATLVLAFVTAVLAVAAFWTIRQNHSFRKKEYKQKLLNEIVEWAIDVNKCGMEHRSTLSQAVMADPVSPEKVIHSLAVLFDLSSNIQGEASTLIVRSEYIETICKVFNKHLYDIFEKVVAALNVYNNSLLNYLNAIPLDMPPAIKASDMNTMTQLAIKVNKDKQLVKTLTNEFTEKATKIKTRL